MSLTLLNPNPVRQTDATGAVCSGAQLYTYAAGTTTNQATYTDATGGTPLTNPVIADATGLFPQVWLSALAYDFYCYTSTGTLLWQSKGIAPTSTTAGFTPISVTGTDTIVGTFSPGISFYQTGQQFQFQAVGNNASTTVTINISGLGPIPVYHSDGTALAVGDIKSGQLVQLYYTGSFFQYVNYYPSSFPWTSIGNRPAQIQSINASVAANALTVTLNATALEFRSTTLTSGTSTLVTMGSSVSLTVPTLATLGMSDGVQARLMVVAINNAGTVELAITNLLGGLTFDETSIINTSAIASGTSANVFYSATARTGVAFRVVGFIDITEATAGTWATAPSFVQGAGGNSLAAIQARSYQVPSIATTSGTTIDLITPGIIPSWAKRITVQMTAISTSGTSLVIAQIGSGAGYVTSGYSGAATIINTGVATVSPTTGFGAANATSASDERHGTLVLTNMGSNKWVASGSGVSLVASTSCWVAGGSLSLPGSLDRIRLTTVGGTDTFDNGLVSMLIEG